MQSASPILILTDQNSENKFSSYITEILQMEGFLEYEVKDLSRSELDVDELLRHDIVVLSNIPLSSCQKAILTAYVQKGGGLIGLRPPKELGFLFRVRPLGDTLSERYIKLETQHPLSEGMEAETLQYHGEADIYALNGAQPLAYLSNLPLSSCQKAILTAYVQKGGGLIGLRPPKELGFLFRVRPLGDTLSERYIKLETQHPLSEGIEAETLQYHGEADIYALNGAQPLAYLCHDLDCPTRYPAIATHEYARGRTAIFAYDLAASTVLFHQGRSSQSSIGDYPDPDSDGMFKPTDLFLNQIDIRLKHTPQADIQQDILVNIMEWMAGFTKPLPRVWYFPDREKGLVFIGGDSDGMSLKDFETTISTVEKYSGVFTTYLMEEQYGVVTPQEEQSLREKGHSFGPHLWQGQRPSLSEKRQGIKEEIRHFRECYGYTPLSSRGHSEEIRHFRECYGYTPLSSRGHSVIWVGWTEQAKYLSENGIRLSCDFTGGKYIGAGYVTGSGLPWKFINKEGHILDIYEQPYQICDDGSMHDKSCLPPLTLEEAIQRSYEFMDAAFKKYHTVFQVSLHPIYIGGSADLPSKEWLEAVLAKCKQENLRTVSADEWVRFNDGRRAIEFRRLEYYHKRGVLTFDFKGSIPVKGITLMLPVKHLGRAVSSVAVDNAPVEYNLTALGGTEYAVFVVDIRHTEWHRVEANYTI